jgi:hypothetical protein
VGVGVGVADGTIACTGAIRAPVGHARLAQANPVVRVESAGACRWVWSDHMASVLPHCWLLGVCPGPTANMWAVRHKCRCNSNQ